MRKNKGITLIALVITIIVLIILAGISLNIIFGNGGLVEKTKQGSETYKDASTKEKIQISAITASTNNNGKFDKNVFKQELDKSFGVNNYTMTEDSETGEITVTIETKKYVLSSDGNLIDNSIKSYDLAKDALLGTDTSNTTWDPNKQATGQAKLDLGETVNLRLKKIAALANGISEDVLDTWTVYNSEDTYITNIRWWTGNESDVKKVPYGQLAMTADSVLGEDLDGTTNELIVSDVPIWAWYENGTIYIWSSDSTIDMHPHSERMFQGMKNLDDINGLQHFVSDNVTTMRYMFYGCNMGYYNYTNISNWNISNVKTAIKQGQENLPGNNGFYKICPGVKYGNNYGNLIPPDFSERPGIWDSEGSYIVGSTKACSYSIRDKVTVGGEQFYVIEECPSTQNTVKLLAKYPLNKAGTAQVNDLSEDYAVAFSSTYYWKSKWDEFYDQNNYAAEDWDSYLNRPYGAFLDVNPIGGYSDGDAIDKAKKYAAGKNATQGRLLTTEEFSALGSTQMAKYRDSVLDDSYYWLGSAMNYVNGSSHYGSNQFLKISVDWLQGADYTDSNTYGVRPVLFVPREYVTLVQQW